MVQYDQLSNVILESIIITTISVIHHLGQLMTDDYCNQIS